MLPDYRGRTILAVTGMAAHYLISYELAFTATDRAAGAIQERKEHDRADWEEDGARWSPAPASLIADGVKCNCADDLPVYPSSSEDAA